MKIKEIKGTIAVQVDKIVLYYYFLFLYYSIIIIIFLWVE